MDQLIRDSRDLGGNNDSITEGRLTLMSKFTELKPSIRLPTNSMGRASDSDPSEMELNNNFTEPDWQKRLTQTKQIIMDTTQPESPACHDDFCEPVPKEIFILIGLGRKNLFDYCRMRIFNSLFSWKEIEDELREIIWP